MYSVLFLNFLRISLKYYSISSKDTKKNISKYLKIDFVHLLSYMFSRSKFIKHGLYLVFISDKGSTSALENK